MNTYHHLTEEQLTALASGVGGPAVIAEINESQISLHLMMLFGIADRWPGDRDSLRAAVEVLARVQRRSPRIYAELIGDPMIGAWLIRTSAAERPDPAAYLHLGGVAAAAALRAGLDAVLTVHTTEGRLVLPTLGDALLGQPVTGAVPLVITADGGLRAGDSGARISVRPLRHLRADFDDQLISVRLEDANPYRGAYHAPPSDRLPDDELAEWQHRFTGAWSLLTGRMPAWAAEIAQGLRAIVPLADLGDGSSRSGTARESVGAMGMSRPQSAADMAITLVHEFHHSKLSGVIDIVPLYQSGGTERHAVPWKTDKRPVSGLIQGVYAFMGVADAWHHLGEVPELSTLARRNFTAIRDDVGVGLEALEKSTELTPLGQHFVDGMRARFEQLRAVPAP